MIFLFAYKLNSKTSREVARRKSWSIAATHHASSFPMNHPTIFVHPSLKSKVKLNLNSQQNDEIWYLYSLAVECT
jgi:hypothetical protein